MRENLWTLRDRFIEDISQLYDARVACDPDFTELSVVQYSGDSHFTPFFHLFDYTKNADDPTISWVDLKADRIKVIESLFDTLEVMMAPTSTFTFTQTRFLTCVLLILTAPRQYYSFHRA